MDERVKPRDPVPQVRAWRLVRALSQRDLSAMTGIERANIARIETGRQQPRPSTLRKLAKALGLKPEQLFERPDKLD